MADISKEIWDFRSAIYGEEVRGSMISLAEKLNNEVSENTVIANVAANIANAAAENANKAAGNAEAAKAEALVAADVADTAATNANAAAANTEAARNDLERRVAEGEFKGEKGDKGDKGDQGESGVMAPSSGMFSLFLDPESGNLYADYPDGENPPAFQYDETTGNLYYLTGEDAENG